MISDVFSKAVEGIDSYLDESTFDEVYTGELRAMIEDMRNEMAYMQRCLDDPSDTEFNPSGVWGYRAFNRRLNEMELGSVTKYSNRKQEEYYAVRLYDGIRLYAYAAQSPTERIEYSGPIYDVQGLYVGMGWLKAKLEALGGCYIFKNDPEYSRKVNDIAEMVFRQKIETDPDYPGTVEDIIRIIRESDV